ncbi:MAG: methionyl-tRNA formyltransferase, partial [Candidatus Parcubacteria bacterium]|nr:methionyl-tRNA formyltransferase [Candidatus Parcubacteria bacterium]
MSIYPKEIKVIFMGTPEFSAPILNALIEKYKVIAVVTQPDKKVGRKQIVTPSPIKKIAVANKIEVLQPAFLKDNVEFIRRVKELNPDVIIIAAYGLILPKEILDIPQCGVLNVHASLLPKYRGASPIQAAILNGDKETGVTIMLVNERMDEGDILTQKTITINNNDNFEALYNKLSELGANLLLKTLPGYLSGQIKPKPQEDSEATYCQLITKDMGKIDWHKSALEIDRQIRAFTPWPGTYTTWQGKNLKILSASADGS